MEKEIEKEQENYEAPDVEITESDLDNVSSGSIGNIAATISPSVNVTVNSNVSANVVAMPTANTGVSVMPIANFTTIISEPDKK